MDLRDLLQLLRARWIAIVSTTVVGALVGVAVSLLATPQYQSALQFYVTVSGGENVATAAYQGSLGAQQRVQSYAALVDSADVARRVIEETGVDLSPREVVEGASASADPETVLLNVEITDSDPARALIVATGYGAVLPTVIQELETPDNGGSALARLTVVNPPELAPSPASPVLERNIAMGIVLGALIGCGVILLLNALDRRVKSAEDVESVTRAPVIGSIPFRGDEDKEEGEEHIVPFRHGHSPAAEAFRRLRTNLQFLNVDSPPRVLVLTSSVAMEGKSETAINLSLSLAEAGSRVLLIEADLRRPRVVTYMSMPDKVGLTNILAGQAKFADVVQETRHEGVDLLACGPLPPNPSELLASEVAVRLLSDLRKIYDYVIIDSPPLLPVTDGSLIARIADGAILVVRANRTQAYQVAQSVSNLSRANAALLGVVLVANKPAKRGSAEYYDSYYASARK